MARWVAIVSALLFESLVVYLPFGRCLPYVYLVIAVSWAFRKGGILVYLLCGGMIVISESINHAQYPLTVGICTLGISLAIW